MTAVFQTQIEPEIRYAIGMITLFFMWMALEHLFFLSFLQIYHICNSDESENNPLILSSELSYHGELPVNLLVNITGPVNFPVEMVEIN